jgi:coatomer subunit beta'
VIAEKAYRNSRDLGSLLLLYISTGSQKGLEELVSLAKDAGQNNIAFTCQLALNNFSGCIDTLLSTGRYPESALFAKTYQPKLVDGVVEQWKADLLKNKKEKIAKSIASPAENPEYFPGWAELLEKEGVQAEQQMEV